MFFATDLKSGPSVAELYSGAGFFSFAFKREGFQLLAAIEIDPIAAATYRRNLGDHITVADVRTVRPPKRHCDVLICGSPCQGYSTLGKRDLNDPRNVLSLEVVTWARQMEPTMIVLENVPAFLNAPIWRVLTSKLKRLGYRIEAVVVDAFDYGTPQHRRRSFTFAVRGAMPELKQVGRPISSVRQAWRGLSEVPNGINHHYSPTPSSLALARMRVIPPGGDKRDVMRSAPDLAAPSWWNLQTEITDVWGRMEWDCPSNTIRTALQNPSKGRYIHPEQHRVISLREAARLQTVPDSWEFEGLPTQIARQIGNGVPVALGRAVARAVYTAL